jgi:hypothetical protein
MNLQKQPPKPKAIKQKRCKACRNKFTPAKPLQSVCDWQCGAAWAKTQREKKERAEHRVAKIKAKSRGDWTKEAQAVFNKFIRLRDAEKPCVSCGRENVESTVGGAWDCGHYLSVGSHPEIRFNELNAAKQCKSCNGGAGNYSKKNHTVAASYRVELIKRIGLEKVEFLEGAHEPAKYTILDLIEIKAKYTKLCKELKSSAS